MEARFPNRLVSGQTCQLGVIVAECRPSRAHSGCDGDVGAGRKVAEQHFSRCHVIGDDNEYGGIGSTPSFQLLASSFLDDKDRFATFFARRPHPVFVIIEG